MRKLLLTAMLLPLLVNRIIDPVTERRYFERGSPERALLEIHHPAISASWRLVKPNIRGGECD